MAAFVRPSFAGMKFNNRLSSFSTPRWVIFIIDLVLAFVSIYLSYQLRFDFKVPTEEWQELWLHLPIIAAIFIIGFYVFKPYSGMIRYTGSKDLKRIVITFLVITVALYLANQIHFRWVNQRFVLPTTIVAIQFFIGLFLLIGGRMVARFTLLQMMSGSTPKTGIIIYGAGAAGNIAKRTIDRDEKSKFSVVAFIDDNPKKSGKRIEGVKIYASSKLKKVINKTGASRLIIAIQQPNTEKKQFVIETCLEWDVDVLSVPPVDKWINGELSVSQIKQINVEDLLGREPIKIKRPELVNFFANKIVLITGAAGSIGSEIVRQVLNNNPKLAILLDQAETPLYDLQNELLSEGFKNFEIVVGDISSSKRMERLFAHFHPEIVFHAAAYKHVPLMEENPAEAIRVNIKGTRNLVNLSEENKVEQFVFISTDKAVNPTNVMGASKRVAEMYVQSFAIASQTRYITTRFGNVLGSNGSVIPLFKKQIERGGPITITHPEITRYFMTIPEAVSLVLEAGLMGKGGEIFVFDMGESVKIIDLAKKILKLSGLEPGRDIEIKFTGLRPGEKLYEELLADEEQTIPTHHHKIMVAQVRSIGKDEAITTTENLINLIDSQNNELLVSAIKQMVPEFISNNSQFEKLDRPQ